MDDQGNTPQTTLRETIAEQMDALEEATTTPTTPAPAPAPTAAPSQEDAGAQDAGDKPGRTAGRARDEQGRLLPGKPEKPPAIPPQVAGAATPSAGSAPALQPAAEPVQRPSSWKKEMWEHWDKLPPDVARYINQRESEFAKGVSTYRQEYENARPLMEAMSQFAPLLQQHNIQPAQWISNLGNAHKMLALGNQQEKLGIFAKLARDYQIPLEQMFVQGQDGKIYINQNLPAPQAPQQATQDVEQIIQRKLEEKEAQQAARSFTEAKDAAGNPAHPHFDTVRESMSQLLAAGIAQDLQSAYDAALRLPQHQQLFDQLQQQKQAADELDKQKKLADAAALARRNAVSVRSATPASKGTAPAANNLRGIVESAFDEHVSGGRV